MELLLLAIGVLFKKYFKNKSSIGELIVMDISKHPASNQCVT
jgi:hypothetical protein